MSAVILHRDKALQFARIAQAGCAVLLVAAIAIAAVGLPGAGGSSHHAADLPPSLAETAKPITITPPVSEGVDFSGIAQRLASIDNAPKPATETPTDTEITAGEPAPAAEAPIKFLGSIIEPNRRVALLSVNGRQRAVVAGQKLKLGADASAGELLLVAVDDNAVTIEDKGGRRTIQKTARSGSAITTVAATAPAVPTPDAPPQPGVDPAVRALRDAVRGMDPEKRRQALQEFQRARGNRDRNQGNE
ncbi:MAG: hypothetical protein IT436_12505 [Phycisphaerales bacterium]|nr:hypothetical protein [Phycisphaerales bacterium]